MSVAVRVDGVFVLVAVAVAGGVLLYSQRKKIAAAAGQAAQAVNPANPGNVLAGSINNIGAHINSDPNWTLGGSAYDFFNPYAGIEYSSDPAADPIRAVHDGYTRVHGEAPDTRSTLQKVWGFFFDD